MAGRQFFLKDIQRNITIKHNTRYLTDEEKLIRQTFRRPEYANEWISLRRKVFEECEDLIQETLPLLSDSYPDVIVNIARNIVRMTWPFSASESHHHPQMGGLPIHLCETMLSAVKFFQASNTPKSLAIEASDKGSPVDFMTSEKTYAKALFSICMAALAHDVGKVFDQQLEAIQPGIKFYPLSSTPETWLGEQNLSISNVKLHWLAERERERHAIAGIGILLNLLSPLMARSEYSDIVASFIGEHVLVHDPDSNVIPTSNLSKIGTFMHLTNLAILYHNNFDYEEESNFVLNILRQADVDSALEWSDRVLISFDDYFMRYIAQEIGETIMVNKPSFMSIFARKNSRYVLMPIKRLHEGFNLFVESHGKVLNLNVDGFQFELTKKKFSPSKSRTIIEPLLIDISVPEFIKGTVKTMLIDTIKLETSFTPKNPDIGIFLKGTNSKNDDTFGLFYFTPPVSERIKKRDFSGLKDSAEPVDKSNGNRKNIVKESSDFDAFIAKETVNVDDVLLEDNCKKPTNLKTKDIHGKKDNGDKTSSYQLSSNDHPRLLDRIVKWVKEGKLLVNDFSTSTFLLVPEKEDYMYVKVKDPILIDVDFTEDYVIDLVKLSEKHWGESFVIYNGSYSKIGAKGGANGDYLIRFKLHPDVASRCASRKGIIVNASVICTDFDGIIKYCGLS